MSGTAMQTGTNPRPSLENPNATPAAKRGAALRSVLAAAGITLLKIVTGIFTGSLGMLSEAAHSGIDLIAAALTLWSVQLSDKPADDEHSYGHGRVESLSAFIETVLMLVSCIWIVVEAVRRLLVHKLDLRISIWPILVLILSIVVDYTRSRQLRRVALASNSQALEADALHFSTDIWSSFAVLIGLAASFAGARWKITWLEYADPIAAMLVSAIILRVSWRLARETVDALLDATPPAMRSKLTQAIAEVDGVVSVDALRMRRSGANYFADVTVGMPRTMTFQRSEQLVCAATEAVQRILPGTDVVVRTVPVASVAESVFDRVRAVASRANLSIHDVSVQEYSGGLHVEQHLELDERLSLREAHDVVTKIEAEMRRELPQIATITTHIESEDVNIEHPVSLATDHDLEQHLRAIASTIDEILDVHDVVTTRVDDRIQMSCHCTMPDDLAMSRVHRIITELESRFRRDRPQVARLLIHPEPATD